jgi:hypothetical protein
LATDYATLQTDYYNDVPSVTIAVPIGTGFQRDWVQGHYYNPAHSGIYAYNIWKYNGIPGDVNRDGKVSMFDVIDVLLAFGSYYGMFGPGTLPGFWPIMNTRWNFYCDVIGTPQNEWTDRRINMGDIVTTLTHMFEVDTPTGTVTTTPPAYNGAWRYGVWYGIP